MRLTRLYYPVQTSIDDTLIIEGDRAHYLKNVLRIKTGQEINIFNHLKKEYKVRVSDIDKKNIKVLILQEITGISSANLNITLIQSMSKGDRMDYTVQKATELGINRIQPITSEYCEIRLKGDRLQKKLNHWKNIAISACEQSFRPDVPEISEPVSLQEYCDQDRIGILLEPEKKLTITDIAKNKWQEFDIVVGPEGGWSPLDLQQLESTGLTGMQFGQRVLRTETVAPAILAAIHSLWGDFV